MKIEIKKEKLRHLAQSGDITPELVYVLWNWLAKCEYTTAFCDAEVEEDELKIFLREKGESEERIESIVTELKLQ